VFWGLERGVFEREDMLEESIMSFPMIDHVVSHGDMSKIEATADMEGAVYTCEHSHIETGLKEYQVESLSL
jgi:hypothetical protein